MSEKQARRPPVAPKPSFIRQQNVTSARRSPLPSPALQGATLAFGPGPVKTSNANASASHNPSASAGALLAATTASTRKLQQQQQLAPPPAQDPPQTLRGRALTTERAPTTVPDHDSSSPSNRHGLRPHAPRSTSAVAAVAASTKTSPVRRPEIQRDQGSYLARRDRSQVRGRGMSTSSNSDAVQSLQQSAAALAGAKASMTTASPQVQAATGDRQRNDLGYLSHLTLPPAQRASTPTPSISGTTAAATATRNAASLAARNRALSVSQESSPGAPVPRNLTTSPQTINGSQWARVRVTPPETDSESDSGRAKAEPAQIPLPAPTPIRNYRAALTAHQVSGASSPTSPILDARAKLTASSLADAMVASSLAATHTGSRGHSPAAKKVPPPVPRRRSKSVGAFEAGRQLMHLPGMRSDAGAHTPKLKPLPARPMRHTLRSSPERDEPEGKRGRKHWRRHPNMHHEGDRRRWRDKVTEQERKRYEGVWAANRGLLLDYDLDNFNIEHRRDGSPVTDLVVNVVVQDIWERSRLPGDVLEEIWDLVAQPGQRTLNREEFVVGLWLIDQRLKGRKLPVKVSQSVWSSVRHTQGVRISSKPLQK